MKETIFHSLCILVTVLLSHSAEGQGWVAEFDLDLNHDQYAYEKINQATLTFSGVTVTGSSPTSKLELTVRGSGELSGEIVLSISGLATDPYYAEYPESEPISAFFSGNYAVPCITGFFSQAGESTGEQVYIWVTVYPQMEITDFSQTCEEIILSTSTCSRSYLWEISDDPVDNFRILTDKSTSSISVTREELAGFGFSNTFGRKYFRVTGVFGTTSQLQAIDVYYPGPSVTLNVSPPKCHGGGDGAVAIDLVSGIPEINDFVVTLFRIETSVTALRQEYIADAYHLQFSGLPAGQYKVRAENSTEINTYGSCWVDKDFTIWDPDPVMIQSATLSDYNGYAIKCQGGSDGRIEIKPAGGTGNISFAEWTPAVSQAFSAENLPQGDYQVRVRDSNGCWSGYYLYELEAPATLRTSMKSTGGKNGYDVSCYDKTDGEIVVETEGGVGPYVFQWADGTSEASRINMAPGSYTLNVSDANGCKTVQSTKLVAPEPITFSITELETLTCPDDQSGILEIADITNNIGAITYEWSSGETQQTIYDKSAGIYTAKVSDEQGCSATLSHTLVEPQGYTVQMIPVSDFNGSNIRCHGESNGILAAIVRDDAGEEASAEYYEWSKNTQLLIAGPEISRVTDLTAATYNIRITYRTACKAESTFVLTEPDPVAVSISMTKSYNGMAVSCYGSEDGSLIALATGGTGAYSYYWNEGQQTENLSDIGAGEYIVNVTDANGCEAVGEIVVEQPSPLVAEAMAISDYNGQPISCAEASDARIRASAQGGTAPYAYEWESGLTTQERSGLGAGSYSLTVQDVNGCSAKTQLTLNNPSPVMALILEESNYNNFGVSCFGANDGYLVAAGGGGTGKYTFSWEGSSITSSRLESLTTGDYTVTVTDQNGCHDSERRLLSEPEGLSVVVSSTKHASCFDARDGEISLSATGGAGAFEFSVGGNIWQSDSIFRNMKAGPYTVHVRDANGCTQGSSTTLYEPRAIDVHFEDIGPALCGDATGSVTGVVSGGTGTYNYTWKDPESISIGNQSTIGALHAGIYTLSVSDENQCLGSGSVGITSIDGPKTIVKSISPVSCSHTSDGSVAVEAEGDGPFLFIWPNGEQTPEVSNLAKGEHLLQVRDVNGCIAVQRITVPGPDPLTIELEEKSEPSCYGACDGKLLVSATGGNTAYSYRWQEQTTGPTLEHLCAGEYVVTVVDDKNCSSTRAFQLLQPEPLKIETVQEVSPVCPGGCDGQIRIFAAGGTGTLQYHWDGGQSGPLVTNLCSGTYTTLVTDINDCKITVTSSLEDPLAAQLELGGPVVLCEGQTHVLDAGPQWTELRWQSDKGFSSNERVVSLSHAGTYSLTAIDRLGCIVHDTLVIDTEEEILRADFLLTSEASRGDTVVFIDISWPLPDEIAWIFPEKMKLLDHLGDIVFGHFDEPGTFDVTLKALLGECHDAVTKSLTITEEKPGRDEGRLDNESFVRNFALYPNPNEGVFDVAMEFTEESAVRLTIWNSLTSKRIALFNDSGSRSYLKNFDLRPLSAGPYTLRLDYKQGAKYIRFIVR